MDRSTPAHQRLPGLFCALLLLPLLLPGCDALRDEDEGPVDVDEIPLDRRQEIPLHQGFVNGSPVEFYRLSTFVPADTAWFPSYEKFPGMPVREIYVWAEGDGFLAGQRPIIDSLPRQARASDFFEVVLVRAPAGYRPDEIKSRATLLRSGYALEPTGRVVNCPVVGPEAALAGAPAALFPRIDLWYRQQTVHCLLMAGSWSGAPEDPAMRPVKVFSIPVSPERAELRVPAGEVYSLRSSAFSAADLVTAIPVPNNDVFRFDRRSVEYTPLVQIWDVTVPSDYLVGQIRSHAELFPVPEFTDPRIVARAPETFCNCPVVTPAR